MTQIVPNALHQPRLPFQLTIDEDIDSGLVRLSEANRKLNNFRAGMDTGEMAWGIPEFTEKYEPLDNKSPRRKRKKKKSDFWERLLERTLEMQREIWATFQYAAQVKIYHSAVKNDINKILESLPREQALRLVPKAEQYKAELREIKTTINQHTETLKKSELLNRSEIESIHQDLAVQTAEIENISNRFRSRVSKVINNPVTRFAAKASACACCTVAKMCRHKFRNALEAASRATAPVTLPVPDTMPLRFSSASLGISAGRGGYAGPSIVLPLAPTAPASSGPHIDHS